MSVRKMSFSIENDWCGEMFFIDVLPAETKKKKKNGIIFLFFYDEDEIEKQKHV